MARPLRAGRQALGLRLILWSWAHGKPSCPGVNASSDGSAGSAFRHPDRRHRRRAPDRAVLAGGSGGSVAGERDRLFPALGAPLWLAGLAGFLLLDLLDLLAAPHLPSGAGAYGGCTACTMPTRNWTQVPACASTRWKSCCRWRSRPRQSCFSAFPPTAVLIFEVVLNATSIFNHANVRLPLGSSRLSSAHRHTPEITSSTTRPGCARRNSNYGFNLSIWDRIFGSYSRCRGWLRGDDGGVAGVPRSGGTAARPADHAALPRSGFTLTAFHAHADGRHESRIGRCRRAAEGPDKMPVTRDQQLVEVPARHGIGALPGRPTGRGGCAASSDHALSSRHGEGDSELAVVRIRRCPGWEPGSCPRNRWTERRSR